MTLNPPRQIRIILYIVGVFGTIALQWASEKGWLDGPDRTALAAVLAAFFALAGINAAMSPKESEGGSPKKKELAEV